MSPFYLVGGVGKTALIRRFADDLGGFSPIFEGMVYIFYVYEYRPPDN